MKKDKLIESIITIKRASRKRRFKQSFEFIMNLKGLNIKNPDEQVDLFIHLPHSKGKPQKICAFIGAELKEQASKSCDRVITSDEFPAYTNKKDIKKLADEYDIFIAQANIMPKVAQIFGRVLGPRGKMPNPKAGGIITPSTNLEQLVKKLRNTIHAKAKTQLIVQVPVGDEGMKEEDVAENILTVYEQLVSHLPGEKNNVRNIQLTLTMGRSYKLRDDGSLLETAEEAEENARAAPKEEEKKESESVDVAEEASPKEETVN